MAEDNYNSDDYKHRLAVQRAMVSAFSDVNNKFLDWATLKMRMTTIIPDPAVLESWFLEIREWKKDLESDSDLPIFKFPKYEFLKDDLLINLNAKLADCDSLTKIACMNWEDSAMHQWDDFNPDVFIKPLLQGNGRLISINGVMDSGKTDLSLTLAYYLLNKNFAVITNIDCERAILYKYGMEATDSKIINNFYHCIFMSDLLWLAIKLMEDGKNIVMIFDESGIFYPKKGAMTKSNQEVEKFIRLIRKFNLNIIFIEQRENGLPPTAEEMLASEFQKLSQKRVHYTTRYLERNYNEWIESVPSCRPMIEFKTKDVAGFRVDVNFTELFDRVVIEDNAVDKIKEIKEFLSVIIKRNFRENSA